MNSKVKSIIKVVFVAGLLYYLYQKGDISIEMTRKAFNRWDLIGMSLAVYMITAFLGIVRWHILLKAHSIHLPLWRTAQLSLVGNFFNIALPGAVSGDFVKAFYIGRESEGKRAGAFGSILFDRVAGLSALVILCAIALAYGFNDYWGTPLFKAIKLFMALAATAVVVFYGYLFWVRESWDPLLKALKKLEAKYPKLGSFARVYSGLRHYHNHRGAVISVLALSLVIHAMIGWASLNFAHALGDDHVSLSALYIVVPLGLLICAVPIAPAGIGTGHWAFRKLFELTGSMRGADVFSLIVLMNVFIGAIGGLVYLQFRSHAPKVPGKSPENPEDTASDRSARPSLKPAR